MLACRNALQELLELHVIKEENPHCYLCTPTRSCQRDTWRGYPLQGLAKENLCWRVGVRSLRPQRLSPKSHVRRWIWHESFFIHRSSDLGPLGLTRYVFPKYQFRDLTAWELQGWTLGRGLISWLQLSNRGRIKKGMQVSDEALGMRLNAPQYDHSTCNDT